ncbi:MAG: FadR family transcriptional regulator [Bosea sp.]|nr:FadR family transcriptional regulator [Bosea sp. (in: a-proteobacteria)]
MRMRDTSRARMLSPDRLFGQVAHKLAVSIISGASRAGDLLPNEDGIRGEISVSRTAYREAVKFLTGKGMVEARPKSGTRVAPRESWNLLDPDVLAWHFEADPNEKFIRDLFELRLFVEPSAARLAAQRRSEDDLARIEAAYRGMTVNPPYAEPTVQADLAFHEAIFEATRNPPLQCLAPAVCATIQWSLFLKAPDDRFFFTASLVDHERVLDAISQRDGDLAAARMSGLVIDSLNSTLRLLAGRSSEKGEPGRE